MAKPIIAVISMIASVGICHADDGILYYQGTPRLMKRGAQIQMVQEFVRIKVGTTNSKTYCRFIFKNTGGPTTARIGFPDGSDHDGDPTEERKPVLRKFTSFVDGKPIKTNVEKTEAFKTMYSFFHVKTVRFGAHQTRVIEDWFTGPLDDFATGTPGYYYCRGLGYIMASGGSWKDNIGKATIQIDFQPKNLRNPHPVPLTAIEEPSSVKVWNLIPKNHIFWQGFARPIHTGNSLIFRRKNFKPDASSDIRLVFGARPNQY